MKFTTQSLPLIPILRGVTTDEAVDIAEALIACGYECIEVPLNSPSPIATLRRLRLAFPDIVLGAGTVLKAEQVVELAEVGVDLILAPNCNLHVIETALKQGLQMMPGVATPSECFSALSAGTALLKAFPGELISPQVIKAWKAVLPSDALIFPVGGINLHNMREYIQAGAHGFGFGSSVYSPGDHPERVRAKALALKNAWDHGHDRFQA